MRTTLILASLLVSLGACQSETQPQEEENSAITEQTVAIITDSIQQLYDQLIAERKETFPLNCNPEAGKVNPADGAPRDTLFFLFREQLKKVVDRKDIFALLPHVDENIKTGFGAEGGLQEFISMWALDSPEKIPQSELWPTLKTILELGGQFNNNGKGPYFEAPYLSACWPATAEPYEYGALIGAGVRLRGGPSLNTQILKTLSYDLVEYVEETPIEETIGGETHPWIKVKLVDGTEGFLYGKFYRSPLDFRVGFQKNKAGEWKIVSLLAGD